MSTMGGIPITTDCRVPVGQLYASPGMYGGPHTCTAANPCDARVTVAEFLLARIAEDEAQALELIRRQRHKRTVRDAELGYIRVFDPKRVADDCEAKRQIVNAVRSGFPDEDRYSTGWHDMHIWALMRLAAPYSDHPDYLRDWKM